MSQFTPFDTNASALMDQVSTDSNVDDLAHNGTGPNPDFWDNAFTWEPKKSHQFVMSILDPNGSGASIPAYLIKTAAKPSIENGEITLDHINIQRYIKGKSKWNALSITIYDAIVPSGAQAVMGWIRQHHESATGRDGYSDFYKRDVFLKQLSPLGEVIEEWKLNGAFITNANFGSLDWATEDVVNIELTLRYDWALLNF
jgi:hypothetical protein